MKCEESESFWLQRLHKDELHRAQCTMRMGITHLRRVDDSHHLCSTGRRCRQPQCSVLLQLIAPRHQAEPPQHSAEQLEA